MTILEKIKFEEDWLSEVNLTKENVRIALDGIRATALEQQRNITNEEMYQQLIHLEAENERLHDALESQHQFYPPCIDCNTKMDEVRRTYDNLSKQRWIPVSERLPKENEYIGNVCKYYLIQDEYGDMHVAHLSNVGWIPMNSLKAIGDEIIAWRELPERYKAESEA